jgi:hypothetical protein
VNDESDSEVLNTLGERRLRLIVNSNGNSAFESPARGLCLSFV